MVESFTLARQGQNLSSHPGSLARDVDSNSNSNSNNNSNSNSNSNSNRNRNQGNGDTSLEVVADIGTDTGAEVRATAGIGIGLGMFRPQPTPFSTFSPYEHGLHIANAGIPQYTFAPTPLLDQFGGGHVGGSMGSMGRSDAGVVGGMGRGGMMGGSGGPLNSGGFAAAVPPGSFHASVSSGPASLGVGVGVQELGAVAVAASTSDHSAGYSSSSTTSSLQPSNLYSSIPIAMPMPHPPQLQRPQNQPPSQQQHQHHQQHLPHPQQHQRQHQLPRRHLPNQNHYKMDEQTDLGPNDIAQQEAAARDFEPHLEGPLVGEKLSSHAITEEYAKADPTYVAKTLALPQTYSHYRPIQGDGNCGWRAIAFAYFETLAQCGNIDFVRSELQRMTGLNTYIEEVGGQDRSIFELMVDETIALYDDIILAMAEGNDPLPNLMIKFNDQQISQCLVYHLRLLACARLKGSRAQYETFIDSSVEHYLETTVMPVNREIDHICVALVNDVLLEPANMVLEIAYLDRSEGDKVNVHRFGERGNGQDPSPLAPVIYLLYRPGHYDILYRETRAPLPRAPVDIQVHRVDLFTHHSHDFQNSVAALQDTYSINMSPLSMIPGLSSSSLSPFGAPSASPSPLVDPYAPSPGSAWAPQPLNPEVLSAPIHNQPSPPQQQAMVRFSKWNFPNLPEVAAENNSTYEPAYTTNTFKNSHYNTAHYNNTHFQPEMYQPGAEEEVLSTGNGKTGGRKRSTDHCTGIKKEK